MKISKRNKELRAGSRRDRALDASLSYLGGVVGTTINFSSNNV